MRYSKLTNEQKTKLVEAYRRSMSLGATDPMHGSAIAATEVLTHVGSGRTAGDDTKADRWAAALTYLVFVGEIQLKSEIRVKLPEVNFTIDDCPF